MKAIMWLYEYSFIGAYGITLVLALYQFRKYFDTPLKFFPIIVCYTLITELLGYFIRKFDEYDIFFNEMYARYNVPIYNLYNIVFYLYWFYVFGSYLQKDSNRRYRWAGVALFLVTALVNPFFQDFFLGPQFYTYVVGALILLSFIVAYFWQQYSLGLGVLAKRDLLSWLGFGLFVFYMGYLPIKVSRHIYALQGLRSEPDFIRPLIIILIVLMYALFCVGLLRMGKMRYAKHQGGKPLNPGETAG